MTKSAKVAKLSPREIEIAAAYADGASYRQIAERFFIAPTTVRTHLRTIYKKLGVSSKIELLRTLEAVQADLPSAEPKGDGEADSAINAILADDGACRETASAPEEPIKEMRLVTAVVVALPATPQSFGPVQSEEIHIISDRRSQIVHGVVDRFEGQIVQQTSNVMVAAFGIARPHEDDVRRALMAATLMRTEVADLGPAQAPQSNSSCSCTIGIATGRIAVSTPFQNAQAAQLVASDTPFLLARALCDRAPRGQIWLAPTTHRLLSAEIECTAHENAFELQEMLGGRAGVLRQASDVKSYFFGRKEELALLTDRLRRVESGSGQAVGIIGEAGIGKSRLLQHFVDGICTDKTRFFAGHCLPHRQFTPYTPLMEIFRKICGVSRNADSELAFSQIRAKLRGTIADPEGQALLLDILGIPVKDVQLDRLSPIARRKKTFATLEQLIANAGQDGPLVMAVEDVHWIDETSQKWLVALTQRLEQLRILLVVTSRAPIEFLNQEWSQPTQFTLPPLDQEQSIALVRSMLGDVDQDIANSLVRRAVGNPFFIEELSATSLNHQSGIETLPQTVETILAARLERLDVASRRLLQICSAIGSLVLVELLKPLAGWNEDRFEETLEALQAMGYLLSDAQSGEQAVRFKHVLVQEAAYQSLTSEDRANLHAQVVEIMQRVSPHMLETRPEEAARHYEEAGAYQDAITSWLRAGRAAYLRSGNSEAINYIRRGLALLPKLDEEGLTELLELKLQLTLGPAIVAKFGYGSDAAANVYARASQLGNWVGDARERFRAFVGLWNLHWVRGELDSAQRHAQHLIDLAREQARPGLESRAHAAMGEVLFHCGELRAANRHLELSISLEQSITEEPISSRVVKVACLSYIAWARAHLGDEPEAVSFASEAVALADELSHPFTQALSLSLKAELHQFLNEIDACREVSERGMRLSREQGFPFWEGTSMVLHGWSLAMGGKWDEGLETIDQGCAVFEGTGARVQRAAWHCLRSEVLCLHGNGEKALSEAEKGLSWCESTGDRYQAPELHRLRGEALHAIGRVEETIAALQTAKEQSGTQGSRLWEARIDRSIASLS